MHTGAPGRTDVLRRNSDYRVETGQESEVRKLAEKDGGSIRFKGSAPDECIGDGQERNAEVGAREPRWRKVSTPQNRAGISAWIRATSA